MLAVTAGVLLLSGCDASSAQETGITSSDPQEPTTISEETKAPDSTESTENTKSTESKASESESSAETAAETESQLQQSEIQPQQTDQQISRINYYDADGKLISTTVMLIMITVYYAALRFIPLIIMTMETENRIPIRAMNIRFCICMMRMVISKQRCRVP